MQWTPELQPSETDTIILKYQTTQRNHNFKDKCHLTPVWEANHMTSITIVFRRWGRELGCLTSDSHFCLWPYCITCCHRAAWKHTHTHTGGGGEEEGRGRERVLGSNLTEIIQTPRDRICLSDKFCYTLHINKSFPNCVESRQKESCVSFWWGSWFWKAVKTKQ